MSISYKSGCVTVNDRLVASRVCLVDESGESVIDDLMAELLSMKESLECLRKTRTRKKQKETLELTDGSEPVEAASLGLTDRPEPDSTDT